MGNVLLVLSVLALGGALLYPRVRLGRFHERVDSVDARLQTVRARALEHLDSTGDWPADAAPGELPDELARALPAGYSFRSGDHALDWNRWEVVESIAPLPPSGEDPLADEPADDDSIEPDPQAPPPYAFATLASLTVHSGDERLLAELLARYGTETSFVRDTAWTLVMPRRAVR